MTTLSIVTPARLRGKFAVLTGISEKNGFPERDRPESPRGWLKTLEQAGGLGPEAGGKEQKRAAEN